jgi:hypothetical protein
MNIYWVSLGGCARLSEGDAQAVGGRPDTEAEETILGDKSIIKFGEKIFLSLLTGFVAPVTLIDQTNQVDWFLHRKGKP